MSNSQTMKKSNTPSVNYPKHWVVTYISLQGKMGKKQITLGRLSNEQDVKYALMRMYDLNIREIISIKQSA